MADVVTADPATGQQADENLKMKSIEAEATAAAAAEPAAAAAAAASAGGGALSPLSGAYLLVVLGEPISEDHKAKMLNKLKQGKFAD